MGVRTSQSLYIWDEIIGRGKSRHKDFTGEWKRARVGWSTREHGGKPCRPSRSGHGARSSAELRSCPEFLFYLNAKGSTE